MKEALQSIEAYENFVYSVADRHPEILTSTLVVVRRGPYHCQLQGSLHFDRNIFLRVYERLDFIESKIAYYSYEVYQNESILYWYDPQPHPTDVALASSHPHHKHIHPDIKHHRIPAPELAFDQPNLPFLIKEIVENLLK
ncbi:MAG: toxin-antitoxin system TumE family protein [bacterium]